MNGTDAAVCAAALSHFGEPWTAQKVQMLDHMLTHGYSGDESQRKVAHDVLNQLKAHPDSWQANQSLSESNLRILNMLSEEAFSKNRTAAMKVHPLKDSWNSQFSTTAPSSPRATPSSPRHVGSSEYRASDQTARQRRTLILLGAFQGQASSAGLDAVDPLKDGIHSGVHPTKRRPLAQGQAAPGPSPKGTTPRRARKYPGTGTNPEKCTICNREAVWAACDTFWKFDPRCTGEISRTDFIRGVAERPTVQKLRFMRRACLEDRLRWSSAAVSLKEFLQLIWPTAGSEDMKMILRWAQLREAWTALRQRSFQGDELELRRIWDLLDPNHRGEIAAGEFVRADIFTEKEVAGILQKAQFSHNYDLFTIVPWEAYRQFFGPVLKQTYVRAAPEPPPLILSSSLNEPPVLSRDVANMLSGLAGGIKS
mmetsp:Transcript_61579/g.114316  ORF Transcript_61579/g.114316 Transcript_61579/m.114316 type:complete len:424 (+) Transcript_61579:147-1418(+)